MRPAWEAAEERFRQKMSSGRSGDSLEKSSMRLHIAALSSADN